MKKNGKKYRRLEKERKQKQQQKLKQEKIEQPIIIEQEVEGIKTSYLSMAHILPFNPIVYENAETKKLYLERLVNYLKIGGWNKRKYESSMLEAYKKIIAGNEEIKVDNGIDYYKNLIVFDLAHFLGYEIKEEFGEKLNNIEKQYLLDFSSSGEDNIFSRIINSVTSTRKLRNIQRFLDRDVEREYAKLIRKNLAFREKQPFGIMVTATMSAGKSMFINSLTGKYICLSQNMACTSKIHSIINKPFEDGFSYEYDHDLVMTAGKEELMNDNELNTSDRIYVSTHFSGNLSEGRYIIHDTPGVNYSGDSEHKEIADRLIKSKNYNMLIYVMNATQLATNDEDEHLEFVKQRIGRTPILFVMNKVDSYNIEDEDIFATIQRQTDYLSKKGFRNPIVCPVSARAGYLAKQYACGNLTRSEERELYNFVDKFEMMGISTYYQKRFPQIHIKDSRQEETQLLKNCGLAYVENIIKWYAEGGK
jgi:ribosome biogenesis GTPase A